MGVVFGIDVGGTFIDVVAVDETTVLSFKVPSTPTDASEGFAAAVDEALTRLDASEVDRVAHGTTVATNAVLQRDGAATAFVATTGFSDLLHIGRQDRPRLYDWSARKPDPVVVRDRCFEIGARNTPSGEALQAPDRTELATLIESLQTSDVESVAVCVLFGFVDSEAERAIRDAIERELPDVSVSLSSEILAEFREYERASTTSLDAFVKPLMSRYMSRLSSRISEGDPPILVMRSGGGTMTSARAAREPVHTLLSGPAAGVVGAASAADRAGFPDAVSFDMGGTSTDVCLIEGGTASMATTSTIDGLPFAIPSVAINTVGAGGGSILWLDEAGVLRVGPRSAGADPGPACYGKGGSVPTITDAHVVLGHLQAAPLLGGSIALDASAAERAMESLAGPLGVDPVEVAASAMSAVRGEMSRAIRVVSVERGRDPRELALIAFGGAGPMHACALADSLEMGTVVIPVGSGVLSAMGLLQAPLVADASRTHITDIDSGELAEVISEVSASAKAGLTEQGVEVDRLEVSIDCRYAGQAHEVNVDAQPLSEIASRFHEAHRARFGWDDPGGSVQVVTVRARATRSPEEFRMQPPEVSSEPVRQAQAHLRDGPTTLDVYQLTSLGAGDEVEGPALVQGETSTILVESGWEGALAEAGSFILERRR